MSYTHVDVAIVGAGIAGLAAARRAAELELTYVVLEARDRIGGRIHTAHRADGRLWDTGAHWLRQPPVNPLIAEVDRLGLPYDRQWRPLERAWQDGEWLSANAADDVMHQLDDAEELAGDLVRLGEDVRFRELLDPEHPHLPLAEAVLSFTHAASPRDWSAVDLKRYGPFDGDWAISGGFSAVIDRLFGEIEVQLESPVRVIDWGGDPIRVDFGHGLIEADRVLVSVSTGVLAAGAIHFAPPLPDETRSAIESLPMGSQDKVSFAVDPIAIDLEAGALLHTAADDLPITFYRLVHDDLLIAILSGPVARELEASDGLVDAALERLTAVFGSLTAAAARDPEATAWGLDQYTAGAASAAIPGAVDARQTLRGGVDDRLLFAGEATSAASFGTAHGAYTSGIDAIEEIAGSLGHAVERLWQPGRIQNP